MKNIIISCNYPITDGMRFSFRTPCNCTEVEGLKINYCDAVGNTLPKTFVFADTHGNDLTGLGNLFVSGVLVEILIDVTNGKAFILNAATNSYLENDLEILEKHTEDIQKNAEDIVQNTEDIKKNAEDIKKNAEEIAKRQNNIFPLVSTQELPTHTHSTTNTCSYYELYLSEIEHNGVYLVELILPDSNKRASCIYHHRDLIANSDQRSLNFDDGTIVTIQMHNFSQYDFGTDMRPSAKFETGLKGTLNFYKMGAI